MLSSNVAWNKEMADHIALQWLTPSFIMGVSAFKLTKRRRFVLDVCLWWLSKNSKVVDIQEVN